MSGDVIDSKEHQKIYYLFFIKIHKTKEKLT